MSTTIEVQGVSKKYLLGADAEHEDNLRGLLVNLARKPLEWFRRVPAEGSANGQSQTIWALKNVSFQLQVGDVLGIVGRNGAGKSTLLKILSRITDPTEGQIRVRGRLASLLEVGTGFHPELTGRENIFLNGAILGMRKVEIEAAFDEIVAFSEIGRFLDTPVKRYSSGMYVRLAFAVAAHLNPDVLVIDEVLAVGDSGFQKKCLGKMNEVAKRGRTVLFVSHNMAAVAQLCNKAIWLNNGELQLVGTPDEVIRAYLASGSQHVCERNWPDAQTAPGDDRVRLLRTRLLQDGECTSVLDINKASRVDFGFQVLREAENLVTGVSLYDQHGTCLFANCDWRPNHLSPGQYDKVVEIPPQTLSEGNFSLLVQLIFLDPDVKSVVLPEALTFDAVDSDHPLAVRGNYKGPWPGALRLALPWSDAVPASSESASCTAGTGAQI